MRNVPLWKTIATTTMQIWRTKRSARVKPEMWLSYGQLVEYIGERKMDADMRLSLALGCVSIEIFEHFKPLCYVFCILGVLLNHS